MTSEDRQLINTFEARIRTLLLKLDKIQEDANELYSMVDERDKRIKQLELDVKTQQERYNALMTARMLSISDNDAHTAKACLNSLIREVDLCIAQLKAQE